MQYLPTTLKFDGSSRISAIAAGSNHVVALDTYGVVHTWGAGQQGQLGRHVPVRRGLNGTRPERLGLRGIVLIGAGTYHSFAVNKEGQVFGWGLNSMGQLGLGEYRAPSEDEGVVWSPTLIETLSPQALGGARVVQISGGEHHTLFLLDDGRVFGCGRVDNSQLGLGPNHPAMSSPTAKESNFIPAPTEITFPAPPDTDENTPNPIVHVSANGRHNLAVSRSGHAYSWGFGNTCQLGLGMDTEEQQTPDRIRWKNSDAEWIIEGAEAGGQHCILLVRKKEPMVNGHGA